MDLASGARRLVVTMTHCNRDGSSKVVSGCDLPLTASGAVDVLITDLALFRFIDGEMWLSALMPGSSVDLVAEKTSANYRTADDLITLDF
jgi:3-oxoacid CoA-transferase